MLQNVHDRLANEAAMVDQGERGAAQADLHIAGSLMQALGALMLELGRATRGVNLNTQPVCGPSHHGMVLMMRSVLLFLGRILFAVENCTKRAEGMSVSVPGRSRSIKH